ncbi:PLP-dependent aminotransferase family protein [Streptomyces sp. NPDC001902]
MTVTGTSGGGDAGERGAGGGGGGGGGPWTAAWELLLPTAAAPARRRGRVLQAALREAVRTGRLAAGTPLPSSRELAVDLGVSRGLVTDAYAQLTAEGYLLSRQGAGTWVAGAVARPVATVPDGAAVDERGGPADFRPGVPDLALFPRAAWAAAHRRVLGRLPDLALGYPDPRGLPELRGALADLLARRRGVAAGPGRLVVCSGVSQALTLLALVLAGRGVRSVAVEDPGSPEQAALFAAVGLTAVPVPVDGDGLDPVALATSGVRAAVVTPSHQFPTGTACPPRRRAALLEWARRVDGLLVEDDYDGDFRYDRAPVGALQGLAPDRVAYAGSVSKTLAPGLRLGWLVAPPDVAEEAAARKRTMDLGNPVTEQAVLAEFVRSGRYDRHLRRCQRRYRERRDVLVRALERHFSGAEVSGIAAGLHVVATLPERHGPEPAFLARAARAGVTLRPLSSYTAGTGAGQAEEDGRVRLVLGYAHLSAGDIETCVRVLRASV